MKIEPFFTERYFARHEFSAPYLLSASDCESMTVDELLRRAGLPRASLGRLRLGYTETQGAPVLRERIAAMYNEIGPDHVVCVSAPEEGIFITMHALLEPADEVVVLSPCYDSLANVAEYLGCRVVRWFLKEDTELPSGPQRWRLDVQELSRLITPRTKLIIVNFPHNPTGHLPSHGDWRAIVETVRRAGTWLFSDEMYRGLEFQGSSRLRSGCDLYERAITLGGLSKAYGLPGLRIGWLALRDAALRSRIQGWKDYTTICASAPAETLAEIALQIGDRLAARSRSIILSNLVVAEPFFARWQALFRWNRPSAGSVALVGLRDGSAVAFCDRLAARQGVLLLPSVGLGFGDGHVRFGFGRLGFPEAMEQLEEYLEREGESACPGSRGD